MRILITGAGSVMGQSIFKALDHHDFGESIEIHYANSDELGAGRYFKGSSAKVSAVPIFPLAADASYLQQLVDYVTDKSIDIVFAGTQHELAKIARFRDSTLKAATVSSATAEICIDKVATAAALERHHVRAPATQVLREYLSNVKIDGAVVVKPNASSASRNIYRFKSYEDFLDANKTLNLDQEKFLVQGQLVGEEFTCGCYLDRYSKSLSTICFRRTLTPDGATFYGEIVHDEAINSYVTLVARALQHEGFDFGHINVQLIVDADGPCLFEINGRLSSTEAPKAHFGFNSCAAYVYNIVKQMPYSDFATSKSGRFLRYYEEVYFK